jgi:hypothetical protein
MDFYWKIKRNTLHLDYQLGMVKPELITTEEIIFRPLVSQALEIICLNYKIHIAVDPYYNANAIGIIARKKFYETNADFAIKLQFNLFENGEILKTKSIPGDGVLILAPLIDIQEKLEFFDEWFII